MRFYDIVQMKQSNKYYLFIGQIYLRTRGRARSLRSKINSRNMHTESGFCFPGTLEVTKPLDEIMQLTQVTQLSLIQKLFQGFSENVSTASEYAPKPPFSILVCSLSCEHKRAPPNNNWPYKLKQFLHTVFSTSNFSRCSLW